MDSDLAVDAKSFPNLGKIAGLGWAGWLVTWLCYFILVGDILVGNWVEIGGGRQAGWLAGWVVLVVYLAIHSVFSHNPCI